jgi:thiol-disulfide isomerase/thioredoxin
MGGITSRFLSAAFILTAAATALHAQCEPFAAVRQLLEKASWTIGFDNTPYKEIQVRRREMYTQGLAAHPHDYFLLRMILQTSDDQEADLSWAKSLREKYPDQPVYELIYAQASRGRDTPAVIRMLDSVKAAHPELTRAHLVLADQVFGFGKFKDAARARSEVTEFVKSCPAPLDASALGSIAQHATQEQLAAVAAAVRKRLEETPVPLMAGVWEALWRLEFKARPPAAHEALRKQIRQDLARLEKAPERNELRWLTFLSGGYQSAGDQEATKRINDEILAKYPTSQQAERELQDRWRKDHPYPRNADKTQMEGYWRAAAEKYGEWHKVWPEDSLLYYQLFSALIQLPDTAPEKAAQMGDEVVALYRKDPNWYGWPIMEFQIAGAFLKYKVNIDKVPTLVEEGTDAETKRRRERLANDQYPDEMRAMVSESSDQLKMERARVLLDYYAAVKQTEPAKSIEAELTSLHPSKPAMQSMLLERRAQAAEVLGRKLDALLLYRAALEQRPPGPVSPDGDKLKENVERLWKEMGGTEAAYALFLTKPKPTEATDSRWERPKNPLPSFSVPDLEGKTWKLANLEGKVVLINLWATWCGPCRAEHPEFQKLYDKLKERPDVSVITFNVDDDLGKVAPYMTENKYTFPVLLAKEVVDQVLSAIAIPQNWFVDAKGKLQWMQIGYGNDPKWQDGMLGKLDEMSKGR